MPAPTSARSIRATSCVAALTPAGGAQASCPPCRALEPRLERIAAEYRGRVAVYRIDIDRDMSVAARFGVKSIPTIVILHDGREIERLDGLVTGRELRAAFERAAAPAGGPRQGA